MIWAKEETMSRAEIEAIQLQRLQETVKRVYEKVAPYRQKMEEAKVKPEDIKNLKDLRRLPFITKQDMRDNYPFGLFAVPKDQLVRIHASSGTTGKPTVVGYTKKDLEIWTECVSRIAAMGGATEKMWHRSALDMVCLPERWDCILDWRTWERRLCLLPLAIQRNKSCL